MIAKSTIWKLTIGIAFVGFLATMLYLHDKDNQENLDYQFKGAVEHVRYDAKGTPYVMIHHKTYYLSYNNWNFNHQIQTGDTLEKTSNSFVIKLTKYRSGKIITF